MMMMMMRTSLRERSCLLVLCLSFVVGCLSVTTLHAQTSTERKVELMEQALNARGSGDFRAAKNALDELAKMAPGDRKVARLLVEVEKQLAIQPQMEEVPLDPAVLFLDEEAEAIARAETDRLRALLETTAKERKTARSLAREKQYDQAIEVLDDVSADLPNNLLTQETLREIDEDRGELLVDQARYLLKSGDLAAARLALDQRLDMGAYNRSVEKLTLSLERAEERAEKAIAAVQTSAPHISVSTDQSDLIAMMNRARRQYVAGSRAAALQSYRDISLRYPENSEAQEMVQRLESEQNYPAGGPRGETRTALLAEVDQSWQRPDVYQEQTRAARRESDTAPLRIKLDEIILPQVSFTQVEIGRVVSALASISQEFDPSTTSLKGVNIVLLDPSNEKPTVTLTLRNTSLKRVLDFVTQSVGYQYEVQSDAVVVRPGGESTSLDTAFFPVSRATVLRMTGAGGASTNTSSNDPFSSSGASNDQGPQGSEAPGMQAFLQQAGVNFDGTSGSSLAYDGSSIIVTQTARNLERIRNILNRYNDIRQVEIEAKFMEVQEGVLEELGVNWSVSTKGTQRNAGSQALYQSSGRSLANAFSGSSTGQDGYINRPSEPQIDIVNNPPQRPGSASLGISSNALANISGVIGEFDVNAVVRALSQKQGTDLLSAPKVTVLSGNAATITVAQELRYPQSFGQTQSQVGTGSASGGGSAGVAITAGTPQEFTTRNVGVELKVTPTVEEDDYSISLDLNPKVTEFDGFVEYGGPSVAISGNTTVNVPSGFYQPIFSVRDISTKVTIWDGATLIMGGLTREEVKKVNDKIPVLGDIPFLGKLFRSKGESAQKRNLLIFVTANLLSPGGSPKKQNLRNVAPSALFQNPVLITPGGAEARNGD